MGTQATCYSTGLELTAMFASDDGRDESSEEVERN